ncbi:hypothetical protein CNMCM6106_005289 [Aspergillus hiratsukae]|uniref:HAUS augmin-like complex subunit 1 n=1 Tax=Aspergillus hiratsukae TaxID=1194566 RepID=A0A8H6V1P7_9EURO|nr:hypothetical protein CNMCM6106_005289 [Aspergillus hiratsukae]
MDSPLLSPAKARQAAIQAKDWAYVNSWLNRQYSPNPVPNFERNEDTLRTLLALAAANDAADEEAALLHRAREEAIREFKAGEESGDKQKKELLDELELCLGENGKRDLDDLAETTAVLGALRTGTKDLGQSIIELTVGEFDAQEEISKVDMLQKYLEKELATLQEQLDQLKSDPAFEVPADLPALTAEWSRSTKMLAAKLSEYQDRLATLGRNSTEGPTIEDLVTEEKQISQLKGVVQSLEHRLKMFHDLPKDIQGARAQYRQLERELNQLIERRDSMFEGLVEKR